MKFFLKKKKKEINDAHYIEYASHLKQGLVNYLLSRSPENPDINKKLEKAFFSRRDYEFNRIVLLYAKEIEKEYNFDEANLLYNTYITYKGEHLVKCSFYERHLLDIDNLNRFINYCQSLDLKLYKF